MNHRRIRTERALADAGNGSLAHMVWAARRAGDSWATVAFHVGTAIGDPIPPETLRRWFPEYSNPATITARPPRHRDHTKETTP